MREVLSLILGGGRGSRLYPLTQLRSKPAVPVAGKYRLIDIPISNCINSGLNRIYVLTQFLSVSLHRHIANTYKFDPFSRGFVEVLAAQQTFDKQDWYQGTADAVRQQIRYVIEDPCREVLILSGDQLYRMDYRHLLRTHRNSGADVTIAVIPVPETQASEFGLVKLDESGRVTQFIEKPRTPEQLEPYRTPSEWMNRHGVTAQDRPFLASMGIYLFNRRTLLELLNARPLATDFGKEIFPRSIASHKVVAHLFDGYWEDLGTIQAYHEANIALTGPNPPFDFTSNEGPIYTRMRFLPASRLGGVEMDHCLIGDGCRIMPGAEIDRCLIGVRSMIGRDARISNAILLGADRYETEAERSHNRSIKLPDIGIGDRTVIRDAIIDKDCRIGNDVRIVNRARVEDGEGDNFVIRNGIVVVPRGSTVPDGMEI
jgi:glucose-1-phosphate adenylyltransferase